MPSLFARPCTDDLSNLPPQIRPIAGAPPTRRSRRPSSSRSRGRFSPGLATTPPQGASPLLGRICSSRPGITTPTRRTLGSRPGAGRLRLSKGRFPLPCTTPRSSAASRSACPARPPSRTRPSLRSAAANSRTSRASTRSSKPRSRRTSGTWATTTSRAWAFHSTAGAPTGPAPGSVPRASGASPRCTPRTITRWASTSASR